MASIYLRNKGTALKPKWQVVESRRIEGKRTPRQKVLCTLGDIKSPAKARQRWKMILDDARVAERGHWDVEFRNKKFPMVKQYASRMSFDEIKLRHDNIVAIEERLENRKKKIASAKQLKIKKERGLSGDANRALEFSQRLTALLVTIHSIIDDGNLKDWPVPHKQLMKARMDDVINFYRGLSY